MNERELKELAEYTIDKPFPFKGKDYNGLILIPIGTEYVIGNCYDESKREENRSEEDIKMYLKNGLINTLSSYQKYFNQNLDEYLDKILKNFNNEDYNDEIEVGEYYGGSSTYRLYGFETMVLLKELIDRDTMIKFNEVLTDVINEDKKEIENKQKTVKLKENKNNLQNFEKIAEKELNNLRRKLKSLIAQEVKIIEEKKKVVKEIYAFNDGLREKKEKLEEEISVLEKEVKPIKRKMK